jgi:MGT family glycosyltransferase
VLKHLTIHIASIKLYHMTSSFAGKKILFATIPGDGHVNPLTGLAVHLKQKGCDVRWYTGTLYAEKIARLGVHFYPFKKAIDISGEEFQKLMPEREKRRSRIARLRWDLENVFISRAPEYYADLEDIYREFAFDAVVADCTFLAIPYIRHLLKVPVINIGVLPLIESSKDLAPTGLGMVPANSFSGKLKQAILRRIADKLIFGAPNKLLFRLLEEKQVPHRRHSVFDMSIQQSDIFLQSGTPGFEYARTDLSKNIRFIGPLLPYSAGQQAEPWFDGRVPEYDKIILVTQGTVEKDVNKILVPTLEAFKNTDTLVIATTGGSRTAELQKRYPQKNLIIADFIPFDDVMPYASVYVTNGGYGGVLLAIQNKLPMVVAGVHEGKSEIAARIGYFRIGINLKTETPTISDIKKAVKTVVETSIYERNAGRLSDEFAQYDPAELFSKYLMEILAGKKIIHLPEKRTAIQMR